MNWFDYLLIALIVVSCVAGVLRGLLREVIALVTWVAAVWIAWHYAAVLEPRLGGALANDERAGLGCAQHHLPRGGADRHLHRRHRAGAWCDCRYSAAPTAFSAAYSDSCAAW